MSFLPAFDVLAAYTLAAAFLTLTPGPDMALYLGRTITAGRAAGFAAFAGTSAGLVLHSMLAAVGVAALLAASATAFIVLKVAGVIYLLFLAVQALRHGSRFAIAGEGDAAAPEPLLRSAVMGFAVNILNPKIVIFFVTFLPQFVVAGDPAARGQLLFLGLWYIVVTVPLTAAMIIGAGGLARFVRSSPRVLRAVDYVFAGVMAAFALRLARAGQ